MLSPPQKVLHPLSFFQSTTLLILLALIFLWAAFNTPAAFSMLFDGMYEQKKTGHMFFFMVYTFLVFFAIPIVVTKSFYIKNLKNLGLMLPENKKQAVLWIILATSFLVPLMIFLSHQKQFQAYYAFNHSSAKFIFFQLVIFPLYYFFEEFFFRGFLLINLWEKVKWHSFWITDIIFTIAHLTKPNMEIIAALPAGIILAFITIKTRSIYPAIIVHYFMGVAIILAANQII